MCPTDNELYFVKNLPGVVTNWRDLGGQLLHEDDVHLLEEIHADHKDNVRDCCTNMFDKWKKTRPDACWDHLCNALNKIKLKKAEHDIKEEFYKGTYMAINGHAVDYI